MKTSWTCVRNQMTQYCSEVGNFLKVKVFMILVSLCSEAVNCLKIWSSRTWELEEEIFLKEVKTKPTFKMFLQKKKFKIGIRSWRLSENLDRKIPEEDMLIYPSSVSRLYKSINVLKKRRSRRRSDQPICQIRNQSICIRLRISNSE